MKLAEKLAIAFYICVALFAIYWMHKSMNTPLPCGISEISPDFSPADREKCRIIRGHKL